MPSRVFPLHLVWLAALLPLASACKPLGGTNPLESVLPSATASIPLAIDTERLREPGQSSAEDHENNHFHGSAGVTSSAEW